MRAMQTMLCPARMHTQVYTNEIKIFFVRGDLSRVTLQIVLKKKKEKKETKTGRVLLDSACGCCKKAGYSHMRMYTYA